MTEREIEAYYSSFTQQELKQAIADIEFEVKANGEMAESTRLGYNPFGASESDYEHEEAECLKHLEIARRYVK